MSEETVNNDTETADEQVADQQAATDQTQDQEDYDKANFQNLQEDKSSKSIGESGMDMILDIPVTIAVEIGRSKINIRNLLKLNQGSIVELDRLAGEPMDLIVNGTLIAHGEVVVVNEKFGVRLTDVISAAERVKKLK
jgi:flagellar motor switch protein FliN/FliY